MAVVAGGGARWLGQVRDRQRDVMAWRLESREHGDCHRAGHILAPGEDIICIL